MTVKISEVWNAEGRSVELARIETNRALATRDVLAWVATHRPDLTVCTTLNGHGFHAIAL